MSEEQNESQKICSTCGESFFCYKNNCWCDQLPHVVSVNNSVDCLCSSCLRLLIEEKMSDQHKEQLHTSGLIVLKEEKLLLTYSKNKRAWYLPGGKINSNETAIEALQREIKEELEIILDLSMLKYYCHITAPAFGEKENLIMEQECFIYILNDEIKPGNEISEARYFSWDEYSKLAAQAPGVLQLFARLERDNKAL